MPQQKCCLFLERVKNNKNTHLTQTFLHECYLSHGMNEHYAKKTYIQEVMYFLQFISKACFSSQVTAILFSITQPSAQDKKICRSFSLVFFGLQVVQQQMFRLYTMRPIFWLVVDSQSNLIFAYYCCLPARKIKYRDTLV